MIMLMPQLSVIIRHAHLRLWLFSTLAIPLPRQVYSQII